MKIRSSLSAQLGLARSLLMYYAIPGRMAGWQALYRSFISPGDLCFDLGAHVGNRSAAMLALGARVVALEPQPLFARWLATHFGKQQHFTLLARAAGQQAGLARLLVSSRTPTVSTLSAEWAGKVAQTPGFANVDWDAQVDTEVTTLDALIAEYGMPAFCKIDVEGSEHEVLQGLTQSLPTLSFEYIPAAMDRTMLCLQRLHELGEFRYNLIEGERPRFSFEGWLDRSNISARLAEIAHTARAGEVFARLSR